MVLSVDEEEEEEGCAGGGVGGGRGGGLIMEGKHNRFIIIPEPEQLRKSA